MTPPILISRGETQGLGASADADQALVSDQARAGLDPSGFDLSRDELLDLRNVICAADADVTVGIIRDLFGLPNMSGAAWRAARKTQGSSR